jgi:hypothetical protein
MNIRATDSHVRWWRLYADDARNGTEELAAATNRSLVEVVGGKVVHVRPPPPIAQLSENGPVVDLSGPAVFDASFNESGFNHKRPRSWPTWAIGRSVATPSHSRSRVGPSNCDGICKRRPCPNSSTNDDGATIVAA